MNKEFRLSDVAMEFYKLIKVYEDNMEINRLKENTDQLCSITEVTRIYPALSKYILTKAINEGLLPVVRIGNERHFYISDIEKFLKERTHKNPHSLMSWRTHEQI